jgi:hypothetical protein
VMTMTVISSSLQDGLDLLPWKRTIWQLSRPSQTSTVSWPTDLLGFQHLKTLIDTSKCA